MTWIWTLFIGISLFCGILTGQTGSLSSAILDGAKSGVTLAITLAGPLCLWSGILKLMEAAGWLDRLSRLLRPFLRRLYPSAWQDPIAREAICGNFSANLLGLGNAATPMGIRAVQRMANGGAATHELCRLVVMNTASIQLFPSTVAAVRSGLGAAAPFDILPAVWITSVCSVTMGLLAAKLFSRFLPCSQNC